MSERYTKRRNRNRNRNRGGVDEDVIATERDTRRATGTEEDDFEATPNEITTSTPRQRKVYAPTGIQTSRGYPLLKKIPLEVRRMIYRNLVVSRSPHPIRLDIDRRNWFIHGGIETAILRTCREVHQEASEILYHENHFKACYGAYSEGINLRVQDPKTTGMTSRTLRSGRSVDMVHNSGFIFDKILHRLRSLTIDVDSCNRYVLNSLVLRRVIANKSRLHMCDHTTSWVVIRMQSRLHRLFHILLDRWLDVDCGTQGKQWLIVVDTGVGNLPNRVLKKALEPILSSPVRHLLRQDKLVMQVQGSLPKDWQSVFKSLIDEPNFQTDQVKKAPSTPVEMSDANFEKMLEGEGGCWDDVEDDFDYLISIESY